MFLNLFGENRKFRVAERRWIKCCVYLDNVKHVHKRKVRTRQKNVVIVDFVEFLTNKKWIQKELNNEKWKCLVRTSPDVDYFNGQRDLLPQEVKISSLFFFLLIFFGRFRRLFLLNEWFLRLWTMISLSMELRCLHVVDITFPRLRKGTQCRTWPGVGRKKQRIKKREKKM